MFLGRSPSMRSFFTRPRLPIPAGEAPARPLVARPSRPLSEDLELLHGLIKGIAAYRDAPPEVLEEARELVWRYQTFEADCLRTRLALRSCLERAQGEGTPFLKRVVAEALRNPLDRELEAELNRHRMRLQRWAVEALLGCVREPLAGAEVVGGRLGAMAALLLERIPFRPGAVVSSVDPSAEATERAARLLADSVAAGRAAVVRGDLFSRDYRDPSRLLVASARATGADFAPWLARLPSRQLLLLLSGDPLAEPAHAAAVADLTAFEHRCGLGETLFRGELDTGRGRRYLLIGRK